MTLLSSAAVAAPGDAAAGPATAGAWRSVVECFEDVAAAHPDRPALVCDGTVVTFGELSSRTAAVAAGLLARGAGPESLVGLLLPRGIDLVVALLGTMRAGAGYLPLDPALPAARLRYMCDNADPALVLGDAASRRGVQASLSRRILTVETCARTASGEPPRRVTIHKGQCSYAIYTSGSTGRPKGVQVTHGSLAALLDGLSRVVGPIPSRVGWNASPSFDASVQQWLRLCRGDTVVLVGERVRSDPQALAALVADERLDELDITPSHLVSLLEHLPSAGDRPLRLLVGGEAIPPALWRRLAARRAAGDLAPLNLYGPTECTVDTTCATIDHSSGPHLGDPLPGARVYVLDDALRPVPPGADGELYVAGVGVARGYLNMPALTAQRFVADVVTGDGTRMYRTGDRTRLRPDGRLEFLGRTDDQVKLRGYRIELSEIEAVLGDCPGVVQAVAAVRHDIPGGAGLVGYCKPVPRARFDAELVRRTAARHLPDYMVPGILVPLDRFPLTASGKVDRAALPAPVRPEPARVDMAPLTPTEEMVAAAWRDLLAIDRVAAGDNFFELGGQSLVAIRLVAHLRRRGVRPVPLVAVFQHPVLRQFAAYLDGR